MSDAEKLEKLIDKGRSVLATHKPNPPNVIGFPTLDNSAFANWKTQTLAFLESQFSSTSPYYLEFSDKVKKPFQSAVQTGLGVLEGLRDDIDDAGSSGATDTANPISQIENLCNRFHLVASQLRDRYDERETLDVQDEYDVQDLFHSLLHLHFEDNICDECIDIAVVIASEYDEKTLPKTRKLFTRGIPAELDISALGVKPRFNKLRFELRRKHIFYLCAFCEPFNTVYVDHLRPTITQSGYTIERGDEIFGTQPIIEDIWESINAAEIILADVTGRNPNVMYEIGMAHTVGKPVVILTQDIQDVPFDLKHYRCIVYSYTPRGCRELEDKIRGTLAFLAK